MTDIAFTQGVELRTQPMVPFDPTVATYAYWGPYLPFAFGDWRDETLAWKTSANLSANLSTFSEISMRGKDVVKLLEAISVNSYKNFPVGSAKHIVVCNTSGKVIGHGVVQRVAEDVVSGVGDPQYFQYIAEKNGFEVEIYEEVDTWIFQIGGPRSLEIVEKASQADFHDLKFMKSTPITIAGHDVRLLRMGMAGTLAYEVYGAGSEAGQAIYAALLEAGEEFDLVRQGTNAYMCNHTENGFPELSVHWTPAAYDDEYLEWLAAQPVAEYEDQEGAFAYDPDIAIETRGTWSDDISEFSFNPFELGYGREVNFDHEFVGRAALEKIKAEGPREMVTLVWNPEDIMKVFASFFEKGEEPYADMPFPHDSTDMGAGFDRITGYRVQNDAGEVVGVSLRRVYTLFYRSTISLAILEPEYAKIGTELTVVFGDKDRRSLNIRAAVDRYPFLDLPRNAQYPVDEIPRPYVVRP